MALIAPILIFVGALAALLTTPAATPILGLSHSAFAGLAMGLALLCFGLANGGFRVRFGGLLRILASAAAWTLIIVALVGLYTYRADFGDVAASWLDGLNTPEPVVGQGGEVVIKGRSGSEFFVAARVDDRPVRFVLDTGASSVVLTAEDAQRIGLDFRQLDFSAPVATANGSAMAAPVRLARIAVGPIVIANVRALVTRPGAMRESLLGMTFLDRLDSFTVERGKLTLRAKKGS